MNGWHTGMMAVVLAALLAGCAAWTTVEPPNVSLADLRIANIGLFEQRYALQLRVQNPNPRPLPIEGMEYRVQFNGVEFGRGVSSKAVSIPAYGEALVEVDMVSSVGRMINQLRDLRLGALTSLRYRITGGMNLEGRANRIPFEYEGEIGRSKNTGDTGDEKKNDNKKYESE